MKESDRPEREIQSSSIGFQSATIRNGLDAQKRPVAESIDAQLTENRLVLA